MKNVIKISNFFAEEDFHSLLIASEALKKNTFLLDWDPVFNRYAGHNLSPFLSLQDKVARLIKEKCQKENLNFSFCYFSFYQKDGVCPPHKDRKECQWTLNVCLEQDFEWPIFIEGEAHHLKANEALFYSGTDLQHWRNKNSSDKICTLCVYCFTEVEK